MDKQRTYFGVFNFGADPSVVTDALGLEPTQSWEKGQPGPAGSRRTHDRWELRVAESGDFETQIASLLELLEARADAIRAAVMRWDTGIVCVGNYTSDHNPGVHLHADLIRRIADLDLSIDFDLYFLGGTDEGS